MLEPPTDLAADLFHRMGVEGVYARTSLYLAVFQALDTYLSGWRDPRAEIMQFPPVMSRVQLETSGYLDSFPNLLGCVCSLHGTEAAIRAGAARPESDGGWTSALGPTDLVLIPAACYPLYPLAAARGRLPADGWWFDIAAECFRREPSPLLHRLQSFRMREFVRIGSAGDIVAFRERYMNGVARIAADLGLPYQIELASDPFFGRIGEIKAVSQRQQALKFELLIRLQPETEPVACMSFNYHRDHFGRVWDFKDTRGDLVHTGCVAFGMDRLTLALFAIHGKDPTRWPEETRRALAL